MTIRLRILLFFFLAGTLITGGIIGYATIQMRKDAESYYISSSGIQLRLMNTYIETFMKTAIQNAAMLAQNQDFIDGAPSFPDFRGNATDTVFRISD
ncbi:MAG: chemotaxis protein, partial [Desulfovibrionaceae bacterium]|nr:chemotaxis protein [Desulfovibrionaceae bacterium]